MSALEQDLLDLVERFRSRFYGKFRGTVTEVDEATLRLKAKIPAVLGDQDSGWAMPCVPYAGAQVGMAFLPEAGAGVWIEFEGGDVSYPIWSGCYWRADEIPSEATPTAKAIVTAAGHKLVLDDDGEAITITDVNGNNVELASSGITVERGGKKVLVSDSQVSVNDGALEVT